MRQNLVLLALGATLAGCATSHPGALSPTANPGIESLHQPIVQRTDYVLDVNSTGSGIPEQELFRLADWFETLRLRYGDRIAIDDGNGYSDPTARQNVAAVAAEFGLLVSDGAPVTAGNVPPGMVRVVVSRASAFVPGCPNWDEDRRIDAPVTTSSNYGCATNSNLAAMIADPSDLVLGDAAERPGDLNEGAKAIRYYRGRAQTGFDGLKSEKTGGQ